MLPWRRRSVLALLVSACCFFAATSCARRGLLVQYEYEEDVFLSLDGSATVYVNASLPALAALRGLEVDTAPSARLDRGVIREAYETPVSSVTRVTSWRRQGRRFVGVRLDVPDIRQLENAEPFSWSTYSLERLDGLLIYRQAVGGAARRSVARTGWKGSELVAVRLHLPSRITYHNSRDLDGQSRPPGRGNILVWEQRLDDRLRGLPLVAEARFETTSILYRTLWLFAASFGAAVSAIALAIWWVVRRGRRQGSPPTRRSV
jgi:hypothetical protein